MAILTSGWSTCDHDEYSIRKVVCVDGKSLLRVVYM